MNDADDMPALIEGFLDAKDPVGSEKLADALGASGDPRAIEPLIRRISDWIVQEDGDVADAVCGALVNLKVMHKLGNLNFRWLPPDYLTPEAQETLNRHLLALPPKYSVRAPGGFPGL
jgi:HEAT repeat protein